MSAAITVTTKNDMTISLYDYCLAKLFLEYLEDGDVTEVYPISVIDDIIKILTPQELSVLKNKLRKNGMILCVDRERTSVWTWGYCGDGNKIPGHIYSVDEWYNGWDEENPTDLGLI